jgi:hypothetical protein
MTTVLLDTNVVSYLLKGDTRATRACPYELSQTT